jgi:hypothetical protein
MATVTTVSAPFLAYPAFISALSTAALNLQTIAYRLVLTNRAPVPATDALYSVTTAPPPAAVSGYPTDGNTLTVTSASVSGGVFTLIANNSIFTGGAGGIGPFRYPILYSGTAPNTLIAYYDNAASVTLGQADTYTVVFNGEVFHIQAA